MLMQIVAIRDRAADCFTTPSFAVSLGAAIRSFGDLVNNPESHISKHPDDYDLFHLGDFNDGDGLFNIHVPRQIAIGKDLVRGPNKG